MNGFKQQKPFLVYLPTEKIYKVKRTAKLILAMCTCCRTSGVSDAVTYDLNYPNSSEGIVINLFKISTDQKLVSNV